jgi:hypothetical protein
MKRKQLTRSRRSHSRSRHSNAVSGDAAMFALGALQGKSKTGFEKHIQEGCVDCQQELQGLANVVENLALAAFPMQPSARLRKRLLASLATEAKIPAANSRIISGAGAGILFEQQGLLISRSADMPWEQIAPGFLRKTLFVDPERNYRTCLLRVDAGTRYPSHRHADVEELLLLEGDLHIHGIVMRPGDYCRAEPDSVHDQTFTESGCLLLQLSSRLDQIR